METSLPDSIKKGAILSGRQEAWSIETFPDAIAAAERLSYACLGGQFQFLSGGSTREMYWLNADAKERGKLESWGAFVTRSCQEVRDQFNRLVQDTDFLVEAQKWTGLLDEIGPGKDPRSHLVFIGYFVSEMEHKKLRLAAHGA